MNKKFFTLIIGAAMALPAIASASDSLIVYSGRSDKFVKPVVEAFTRETGIKVTLHSGKSTELLNKLDIEGERTDADLYISNDAGNLEFGSQKGLFQPVGNEIAKVIPTNYKANDNSWIGLSARARVLVVNTDSDNRDRFKSVFDLAKPDFKGKIGITQSSNESFIAGTTVYMDQAGTERAREWLKGIKDNSNGNVFSKHSHIVSDVAKGKLDAGLVNHYYIYRHLAKDPGAHVKIVLPDQDGMGVAWNVAGAAITKHAKHKAAAEKFMAFVVSEKGQKMFAEVNSEYPTRTGVPASAEVPPAGSFKIANVPMSELGKQRNATISLLEQVGMP